MDYILIMASTNNGSLWQMTELTTRYLFRDVEKRPVKSVTLVAVTDKSFYYCNIDRPQRIKYETTWQSNMGICIPLYLLTYLPCDGCFKPYYDLHSAQFKNN